MRTAISCKHDQRRQLSPADGQLTRQKPHYADGLLRLFLLLTLLTLLTDLRLIIAGAAGVFIGAIIF